MNSVIFFRVDASPMIGTGHLMRCLTLAKKMLDTYSYPIVFIVNNLPESLKVLFNDSDSKIAIYDIAITHQRSQKNCESLIENWQDDLFACSEVAAKYDNFNQFWVVDHYGLDSKWESALHKKLSCQLLVIDDLANRKHECQRLVDSNLWSNSDVRYHGLLSDDCHAYYGSEYFLLRDEFLEHRDSDKTYNKNILVFFGGSDPTGECRKVAEAIQELSEDKNQLLKKLKIVIITGKANVNKDYVKKELYSYTNVKVEEYIHNISEVMSDCAYSIGAGGTTVYERMYMGVQSYVVSVAQNQLEASKNLARNGLIDFLGSAQQVTADDYYRVFCDIALSDSKIPLICEPKVLQKLVDGDGALKVANIINQHLL